MQRRQFLGGLVALAVVPRVALPPPAARLTPLESAVEGVRLGRMRQLAFYAAPAAPEAVAGTSTTWKLLGAIGALRDTASREGLSDAQYRNLVRLAFRLGRRDCLALQQAGTFGTPFPGERTTVTRLAA